MKSIWAFVMTAATVTVYVHVRHNEPIITPVRHGQRLEAATAPAEAGPARSIVVAPFAGGAVDERWGQTSSTTTPTPVRTR